MLAHFLALIHLHTPLDPLHGDGYNFWSGIGSGSPIFIAMAAWWHHHNCYHKRCLRKGHPDPKHGHPVCRKHSEHFN